MFMKILENICCNVIENITDVIKQYINGNFKVIRGEWGLRNV